MRIGLQVLSFRPGQIGGQGVFIRRLLRKLVPQLEDDRLVIFLRPELAAEAETRAVAADARVELVVETPDAHYGDRYGDWNLRLLDAARLDVVYFPLSFFFPRPLPLPVLLHVPDLQHEYFPQYFSAEQLAWRHERIPESVAQADAVVTYTRFSARGLQEKLRADAKKVHVIAAGGFFAEEIDAALADAGPPPAPAGGAPFILYPAADWPHKNHETLLHGLATLADRGRPEHLVLTGILSERRALLERLASGLHVRERVHWLGRVSQPELIRLYSAARLMAFPSRFEGFGIPLVEAMQIGCPIVASRAEAVVETVDDAGYFSDDDPTQWANAITKVAGNRSLQADLRESGFRRARHFDWSRCAQRHLELLRKLGRG